MASSTNALQKTSTSPVPSHLSTEEQTILRVLAEPREMPYQALCAALIALPEAERLIQVQIDEALHDLVTKGYLTSFFENGDVVYLLQHNPKLKQDEQRLDSRFLKKRISDSQSKTT